MNRCKVSLFHCIILPVDMHSSLCIQYHKLSLFDLLSFPPSLSLNRMIIITVYMSHPKMAARMCPLRPISSRILILAL